MTNYLADCERCFGLCCVALTYAKSPDFAYDKEAGDPCRHLQGDYRCGIHQELRGSGLKGCTVYECYGAGQKISQMKFNGVSWREDPAQAKEMFDLLPVVQQLQEMLYYLEESRRRSEAASIRGDLVEAIDETERITELDAKELLSFDLTAYRMRVNAWLVRTSELVREKVRHQVDAKLMRKIAGRDLIGGKLRGADMRGVSLRGVLLIAADLREADLRGADLLGADLRDADLSGADLSECLYLTQAQLNAAKGDSQTKLPRALRLPGHWVRQD